MVQTSVEFDQTLDTLIIAGLRNIIDYFWIVAYGNIVMNALNPGYPA